MVALQLHGTVLRVEQVSGGTGDRAYSYLRLHILAGVDVYRAKVTDDYLRAVGGVVPAAGDTIAASVLLRSYKDNNGQAQVSVSLLAPVDLEALIAA